MKSGRILIIFILITCLLSLTVFSQAIKIETKDFTKDDQLSKCFATGNIESAELKPAYVGMAYYIPRNFLTKYYIDMAKFEDETFIPEYIRNGIGVGQDSDYFDKFYHGVVEWNLSRFMGGRNLKPEDMEILNVGLNLKIVDKKKPGSESYFDDDYIWLDVYDMENRPADFFSKDHHGHKDCDKTLFEDACEKESNKNDRYYTVRSESIKKGMGYKPSLGRYYWLSEEASHDLEKHLEEGWFGLGICDRGRIDEGWNPPTPPLGFVFDYYLDRGVILDSQNIILKIVYVNKKISSYTTPPAAYIDTVEPTVIIKNSEATIKGHGRDPDGGYIKEYEWTLNGKFLSNKQSFKSILPVGTNQVLSFRVKDSAGQWSPSVTSLVTVVGCDVEFTHPKVGYIYFFDRELMPNIKASNAIVIGSVTIGAEAVTSEGGIKEMTLFIDDEEIFTIDDQSYMQWQGRLSKGDHIVKVKIKDGLGRTAQDTIIISAY